MIACDACASPFQPIGVVRLAAGKLVDLRIGDELVLPDSGERVAVVRIGAGFVLFSNAQKLFKLTSGGFPEEEQADEEAGHLMAVLFTAAAPCRVHAEAMTFRAHGAAAAAAKSSFGGKPPGVEQQLPLRRRQ